MIGDINNFVLYSQTLSNGTTTFTFEFDKPTGDFGAYQLYQSYDGLTYVEVKLRIDYAHYNTAEIGVDYTTEANNKVYFEYSVGPGTTDGRLLYFKIQAISESNELSSFTNILQYYTAPTKPTTLVASYDGYEIDLSWDALDTSSGRNSAFADYTIRRKTILELSDFEYDSDTSTLTHTGLTLGTAVCVIDSSRRSKWFGEVSTGGVFVFSSTNKITLASDSSDDYVPIKENLRILIEDDSSTTDISDAVLESYQDTTFSLDTYYVYAVVANGYDSKISEEVKIIVYSIDVEKSYPYLRYPENSDNTLLRQKYWRYLKEVLIDENYYDKTPFSVPYFENEDYNFKGYLGVSNCNVDIYLNNVYAFTTTTGTYGEFNVNYAFNRAKTYVTIQARDKYNIKFSRLSAPYLIRPMNIYTWFAVIGEQYSEIVDTIVDLRDIGSISQVNYSWFVDVFAPFIEIYKSGLEDDTTFTNFASEIFKSFEYASYDESLEVVLDSLQTNSTNFDHYDIYYNESLFDTQRTGYTFTITSTGLMRDDYYYGISACTSTGAETDVEILRVDRRWWPPGYYSMNVLMWDYMEDADSYKVYRGTSIEDLYFLTSTGFNFFIDVDYIIPDQFIEPRLYNYTSLSSPTNLFLYDKYGVNNLLLRLKKISGLVIILYGSSNNELASYNLDRLILLFEKLIPPELRYKIIFANDSKVILYPDGTEIDLTEAPLIYAYYDESYYYHSDNEEDEVYS